ncbi:MAG: phage terminase small subunit P27 family [Methylococcales bacterium]
MLEKKTVIRKASGRPIGSQKKFSDLKIAHEAEKIRSRLVGDKTLPEDLAPPESLSESAKEHWAQVLPLLLNGGFIVELDAVAFAAYCEVYAQWRNSTDQIIKDGAVIISGNGSPCKNPHTTIVNSCMMNLIRLWPQFGMTPLSRTKVLVAESSEQLNQFSKHAQRA